MKEWITRTNANNCPIVEKSTLRASGADGRKLNPWFKSDAATKFKCKADECLRRSNREAYSRLKANHSYCFLCSCSYRFRCGGKLFTEEGGKRSSYLCSVYIQTIFHLCWIIWHKADNLEQAQISEQEIAVLKDTPRYGGDKWSHDIILLLTQVQNPWLL